MGVLAFFGGEFIIIYWVTFRYTIYHDTIILYYMYSLAGYIQFILVVKEAKKNREDS